MVVRSKGIRSKSRQILRKSPRDRGNPPPSHATRRFVEGQKVAISINSAIHKGMPHIRFQGATVVVMGKQGNSYVVRFHSGNKLKELVVRPEHLRPLTA